MTKAMTASHNRARSLTQLSMVAPVAGVSTMAVGVAPSFRRYCSVRYVSIDSTFCWPPAFQ